MRVLVTGGAGFVGGRVAQWFAEHGYDVVSLDNYATGDPGLHKNATAITRVAGDVTDAAIVHDLLGDVDVVVHAACHGIAASMGAPMRDFQVNVGGTMNVLEMTSRLFSAGHYPRIVYLSSASVYGAATRIPTLEYDEKHVMSPYSASKLAAEHYCEAFFESYGVPTTILRLSNVYGPGQTTRNPYCGVIGRFMEAARRGAPMQIHGDGHQTRDFTYIDDVAEAIFLAATRPEAVGRTFNVGTGRETTMLELAHAVLGCAGWLPGGTLRNPIIQHVPPRDIDLIPRRALHCEQIRRALQWVPRTQLAAGLALTAKALH